jgi:hypothetical protein
LVPNGTAAQLAETAFAFASQLGFSVDDSLHVEVLELGEKSTVYRLSWREPLPGSCVVKQCTHGSGHRERAFYEDVASELSISTLRYFGSREDVNGAFWLVLEDAGDTEPMLDSPDVRALLTEWVARLHLEGASLAVRDLPDAGPQHFAKRLLEAEGRLSARLADDDGLDHDDRDILERCVERCRELRGLWPRIEETCSSFPRTLVHGDLVEENLRLLPAPDGQRLVALDWEKAGCGVPAVDLVRVDPELYWEMACGWLGSTRGEFDRLVLAGRIFRLLTHRWAEKSIRKAERAEARLTKLLAEGARLW